MLKQTAPLQPRFADYSMPQAVTGSPTSSNSKFALFALFCIYSRVLELLSIFLGRTIPYLLSVIFVVVFLLAVFNGRIMSFVKTNTAYRYFVLFTLWLFPCILFGFWPGGSVHLLLYVWLPVMVGISGIGASVYSWNQQRQVTWLMAMSSLTIALFSIMFGDFDGTGRLQIRGGTLGNSNDMALLVLVGFPFLCFHALDKLSSSFKKTVALIGIPFMVLAVLRTGSRAGLLTLLVSFLLLLLFSHGANRIKLVMLAALMVLVATTFVSNMVLKRLATLFEAEAGSEATASTNQRSIKLLESVEMTLTHPLFGVGPGVHEAAQAKEDEKAGIRPDWLVSHNTMTQISQETGVPGFALYTFAIFGSFLQLWAVRRALFRIDSLRNHRDLLSAFLISGISIFILNLFGANGYLPYTPLLFVLMSNVTTLAQNDIVAAQQQHLAHAFPGSGRQSPKTSARPAFNRPLAKPGYILKPGAPFKGISR